MSDQNSALCVMMHHSFEHQFKHHEVCVKETFTPLVKNERQTENPFYNLTGMTWLKFDSNPG